MTGSHITCGSLFPFKEVRNIMKDIFYKELTFKQMDALKPGEAVRVVIKQAAGKNQVWNVMIHDMAIPERLHVIKSSSPAARTMTFDYKDYGKAWWVEKPIDISQLKAAIGALISIGAIQFEPHSWCFGNVDMAVTNTVFTDKAFSLSVLEDEWNAGPAMAVASDIAIAVAKEELTFITPADATCVRDGKEVQ